MPSALAEKVALLTMHAVGCTAGFTQVAGVTALSQCRDEVNAQRAIYQERRDRIVEGLNSLRGVSCVKPSGAFYAFPNTQARGIPPRSSPAGCSSKRASPASPERTSERMAKVISGSATPHRSTRSTRPSSGCAASSRTEPCDPAPSGAPHRSVLGPWGRSTGFERNLDFHARILARRRAIAPGGRRS